MAIYPPYAPNYTDPAFDSLMNYGSGAFLTLTSMLALFFNAVVFYVNKTKERMGSTTVLFLILSSSDFLYTFIRVPPIIYNLINPNVLPTVKNEPPTKIEHITSRFGFDAAFISICAIFCLSIMRYIKLGYPMWATAHGTATVVIAAVPMVITALNIAIMELGAAFGVFTPFWSNTAQDLFLDGNPLIFDLWLILLPTSLSLILALATIAKLSYDQEQNTQLKRYGMRTILLLSGGNIAWAAQWAAMETLGVKYMFNKTTGSVKSDAVIVFFLMVFLPSLIALYNPVVLCTRSSKMRAVLKNMFRNLGMYLRAFEYQGMN